MGEEAEQPCRVCPCSKAQLHPLGSKPQKKAGREAEQGVHVIEMVGFPKSLTCPWQLHAPQARLRVTPAPLLPASDQFAELSAELASPPALLQLQNSPNFDTGSTRKHPTTGPTQAPSPLLLNHDTDPGSAHGKQLGTSSRGDNFTLQPLRMAGPVAASLKQSLASTSTHHLR